MPPSGTSAGYNRGVSFAKNAACATLLALASCAKGDVQEKSAATTAAPAPAFVAQAPLDSWLTELRTASPACAITVRVLSRDEAEVSLEPLHPVATRDEPPRQIPTVHYFFVQPFADEADVSARREAQRKRMDECTADAGPGAQHKGRDMNREACAITSAEGAPIPTAHVERTLSVYVPAYFTAPSECEAAGKAFQARLTTYP